MQKLCEDPECTQNISCKLQFDVEYIPDGTSEKVGKNVNEY